MFLEKSSKRKLGLRYVILAVVTFSLAIMASAFVYASQIKEVKINNRGEIVTVKTMGKTVGDVLRESEIKLNSGDVVSPQLDYMLGPVNSINIESLVLNAAHPDSSNIVGESGKLAGNLGQGNIEDEASNLIKNDKTDKVEKIIVEKDKKPYGIEKRENSRMNKGSTKVIRQGREGLVENTYKVVYRDGKEVSRKFLSAKVVTKPVNKVVEYGTMATLLTSRGDTLRYKRVIEMRSTAYDNSYESTGKRPGHPEYGITASGMRTRKGVVAVDPRVIPLGTKLYVESMQKGVPSYGYAIAADTGGAIKGNKIDLYFETKREVDNWGVRKVRVYVLE